MTHVETDVAVIGVGAMGSAALWRLAERGVRVTGFEQFEPGHENGSSHGETRIYRTAYLEGPQYVPLAQRAVELWHELDRLSPEPVIAPVGGIMLGRRDGPTIAGVLESVRVHDLPHEILSAEQVRAAYPPHVVLDDEVAVREHQAGFVRPEQAIVAATRRAQELGAQLYTGTRIVGIEPRGNHVRLTAGDLTCDAGHVVLSAGAWLPALLPNAPLPLRVSRQVLCWFPVENPALFAPERFPIFIRDLRDLPEIHNILRDSSFYGFPSLDGETIKVSVHREGPTADPDALSREVTAEDVAPIAVCIEHFLRGVSTQPVRTKVCMYTNTPDHDFVVGTVPGLDGVTILSPCSGHGFKFAGVMGEIAADLATAGTTRHDIDWLAPQRFDAGYLAAASS